MSNPLARRRESDLAACIIEGARVPPRAQPLLAFESDGPESGTTHWGVSDHGPVCFEIADLDRDDEG